MGGIIQHGGTMLGSARCAEFKTDDGRARALGTLRGHGVDALVVIGGGGSQTGSLALSRLGFPVVGVASTIDNDLVGSDMTIGADTALNIALEAMDRLKVTASSHRRAALVEVMGRDCGYLALMTALAGGAVAVTIPESPLSPEALAEKLQAARARGKDHAIAVVAEGAPWNAARLLDWFRAHETRLGFELRATVLGHVQRGVDPSAFDRLLATRLAAHAVERLAAGEAGFVAVWRAGGPAAIPLEICAGRRAPLPLDLLALAETLAT